MFYFVLNLNERSIVHVMRAQYYSATNLTEQKKSENKTENNDERK